MTETARLFRIFDRYDILARITPGLLAPLVPGISLLIAFPRIVTGNIYRTIGSGVVMIGLLYLFAGLARSRGRAVQDTLGRQWGGFPTEIVLRFRDNTIEMPTKRAYHAALQDLAPDFRLPDANAEAQDPDAADGIYRAVIRRLIDLRRGPKLSLILNDNIAYGFWRNLLGMKGVALALAGCALAAIMVARTARVITGDMHQWELAWATPATQVAGIALLILWAAFLADHRSTATRVGRGRGAAEQLLASLPPPSTPKPKSRAPKGESQGTHCGSQRWWLGGVQRKRERSRLRGPRHNALKSLKILERAKGFEPSTPTLARLCSTPELRPPPVVAGHGDHRDMITRPRDFARLASPRLVWKAHSGDGGLARAGEGGIVGHVRGAATAAPSPRRSTRWRWRIKPILCGSRPKKARRPHGRPDLGRRILGAGPWMLGPAAPLAAR